MPRTKEVFVRVDANNRRVTVQCANCGEYLVDVVRDGREEKSVIDMPDCDCVWSAHD